MSGVFDRLKSVLGPEAVTIDESGTPRVAPPTEDGVRLACELATEHGWRIRIEGRGSWLPPDAPADMILSSAGLASVVRVSAADLVATAQAGVTLGDLRERLAEDGMWLTIDPPGKPERTVGSIVATATSGPLRTRFGGIRDQILGCTVVTADGRVIESGGQVVKNVAGFDLTKLQVGGFGGFGMLTTVHLRLHTLPRADVTAVARGPRDTLTAAGRAIVQTGLEVATLELLSPTAAAEPEWTLAARVLGGEALVQAVVPRLGAVSDLSWQVLSGERGAALWRLVAGATNAGPLSFRLGVLVDGLDEVLDTITHNLGDGIVTAGAAAGGLRWTGTIEPDRLRAFRHTMALQEIPLTVERAPWPLRREVGHFGAYREGVGRVVGRLRETFDPAGRLSVALEGRDD